MSLNIIEPTTLIGNYCFNGSIFVKYQNDCNQEIFSHKIPFSNYKNLQIFCIYRSTHVKFQTYQSNMNIIPINLINFKADTENNIIIFNDMMNEDPRVLCLKDKLFISYSRIINPIAKRFIKLSIKIEGMFLYKNFLKNDNNILTFPKLNENKLKQKNWTFFEQNGLVFILYNIMPLEIYILNLASDLLKKSEIIPLIFREWKHPKYQDVILRGGSQPIEVDGILYVFVHSTDYKMFAITIDPINFDILQVTIKELINKDNKSEIYFPCGVIYDEKEKLFHVSLGVNDSNLGIFSIYKKELDLQMIKVHNFNSVIRKDDIWIADMLESNINLWINSWGGSGNDLMSIFCQENGLLCRSLPWDKLGCHYIKYVDIPIKKIYIISDPIISLATMLDTNCLETNFYKLSNQIPNSDLNNIKYTLTGLLYFMWIQLLNWYNIKNVFYIKELNNKNINNILMKLKKYLASICIGKFENYPNINTIYSHRLDQINKMIVIEKQKNVVFEYIYQKIMDTKFIL